MTNNHNLPLREAQNMEENFLYSTGVQELLETN